MNKTILIIIVVLLAVGGGYFLLRAGYRAPAPGAPAPAPEPEPEATQPKEEIPPLTFPEVKEFMVSGSEFSFNPFSINVKAGDRVKIIFRNDGSAPHNLVIEGLGISTKTIGGGKSDTIEFTASASGTYTFFCSVPGHRSSGMEGQLIVK